ncbi:MAG: hypothetical protein ACI8S6_001976, partial [Myxococcota bacterium]
MVVNSWRIVVLSVLLAGGCDRVIPLSDLRPQALVGQEISAKDEAHGRAVL